MGGKPSLVLPSPAAIWLGGADRPEDFFRRRNIGCVVSACFDPLPADVVEKELHGCYLFVKIIDRPSEKISAHFKSVINFIHKARSEGKNVYVHCQAGISRSATLLTAYIMSHFGVGMVDALGHIQRRREAICPNEGFRKQLSEFETEKSHLKHHKRLCASGTDLLENDIAFVELTMKKYTEEAKKAAESEWFYRSTKLPVESNLVASIMDDGDRNGTYIKEIDTDRKRLVAKLSELEDGPRWATFHFKEQQERLKERLEGKIGSDHKDCGLEWLKSGSKMEEKA
jgi:hypothetical protein